MKVSSFFEIYLLAGIALVGLSIQSLDAYAQQKPSQQAQYQIFTIDPDSSEFAFTVAHLGMFEVNGSFQEFSGFVEVDLSRNIPIRAEIEIRVASINTDDDERDENLRSEEFLDAEKYPVVRFESFSIKEPVSESEMKNGSGQIEGQMTIFGVTKKLKLPFTIETVGEAAQAIVLIQAEFELSRKEFDLSFGRLMDMMVGDVIYVRVRIVGRVQA